MLKALKSLLKDDIINQNTHEEVIMGTIEQLSEKEQQVLTLYIVEQSLKYAGEVGKTFEEVLNEDVFPDIAQVEFAEMICTNIATLKKNGYIDGVVDIAHEIEVDLDSDTDEELESIDFAMCTFENISITEKGKAYMGADNVKTLGESFIPKAKAVIKLIATAALQTTVELAVTAVARCIGFPV